MSKLTTIAAVFVLGSALAAGWAMADIKGSKHDFSNAEWSGGDACAACHTPASETPEVAPLWDTSADLNRTFGTPLTTSNEAGAGTALCLRCHDGTVARDAIAPSRERKALFPNTDAAGLFAAGHGTGNHPVGVDYPNFKKGYRPATTVVATGKVALPSGKVECSSCHDPHDMSGESFMLVTSNARSALCLTCHRK